MSGAETRRSERSILAVGLVVGALASGAYALVLADERRLEAPLVVSGVWLALAFFGCEIFALRTERKQGESYGFMLALVPLAVGLVYAEPDALVVARVAGVVVALALMRQRKVHEAVFEVSSHAAQTVGALIAFRLALGDAEPVGVHGAGALLAGLTAAYLVSGAGLTAVVAAASRRWPGRRSTVVIVRTGAVAALLNAAVGMALASALWDHPHVLLVLTALVLACLACNRIYRGLAHRYKGLETHYEFVSSVVRSSDLDEITTSVLASACKLLRANDAVLLLRSSGEDEPARRLRLGDGIPEVTEVTPAVHAADMRSLMPRAVPRRVDLDADSPRWLREMTAISALAAPITGTDRSVVGALVVTQTMRKAVATFGEADATLLGTLADQASIAIENGMLFHRLECEAADRAHQATHDALTGLPNRAMLTEVLGAALEHAYATRSRVGLLVVDLDSFSQVVDAFGHSSSDGLLIQACSRIRGLLPESATLARLSGEQFAIVMPDVDDGDAVVGAARLLIAGFDPPFQSEGVLLALGVNVGIAVYPEQAIDAPSLVQRAHIAADTARRHRSGWELYDPQHDPATPRRLALAADLREALETDGLDVCFQPKVELASGVVRGAEALVRWNHPRLGRVRPDEFITIAEHTGDIRALTMVVMRKALGECRLWRDYGLDLSVAVNLSARNLLDLHLVDDVAAVIEEAKVPAASLTLELTESMVMSESQRSVDVLTGLNALGVQLSCDDFGTGYSSLAHLRRLPIGEIKIDKSFIARMTVDESDRAIARSVLALGRDLGLTTVAEGVESREAWDLLTGLGCDMAQGFVVCPPLTSRQFGEWLDRRQPEEFAYLDGSSGQSSASDAPDPDVAPVVESPPPAPRRRAPAVSPLAGLRPGSGPPLARRPTARRDAPAAAPASASASASAPAPAGDSEAAQVRGAQAGGASTDRGKAGDVSANGSTGNGSPGAEVPSAPQANGDGSPGTEVPSAPQANGDGSPGAEVPSAPRANGDGSHAGEAGGGSDDEPSPGSDSPAAGPTEASAADATADASDVSSTGAVDATAADVSGVGVDGVPRG